MSRACAKMNYPGAEHAGYRRYQPMLQVKVKLLDKDFLIRPLVLDVFLDALGIRVFAHGIRIESTRPQVAAPKEFLHLGMQLKYLFRRDTLDCLHYLRNRQCRDALYQKMHMVLLHANFDKIHLISTRNPKADLFQRLRYTFSEHLTPVFRRKHEVIQQKSLVMMLVDVFIHTTNIAIASMILKPTHRVWVLNPIE